MNPPLPTEGDSIQSLDSLPDLELVPVQSGAWTLRSRTHSETFHPVIGPAAEAEVLHVAQQRLAERARDCTEKFVIWDVGLGGAANAVAALRALADGSAPPASIHSFDLGTTALRFALEHRAQLGYFKLYAEAAETLLEVGKAQVAAHSWQLHLGDFGDLLASPEIPAPHAILYDPYSPASNPSLWSLGHFIKLHRRLEPGKPCLLTSYSRSTAVRVTLLLAGFFVGHGRAIAEKDQTTVASNSLELLEEPLGAVWLERVRRSTRSAPLPHSLALERISPQDWERLCAHPQFAGRH